MRRRRYHRRRGLRGQVLDARRERRAAMHRSVRGKTVALVGGAASLLKHGDGARIDACDVVIRVNWPRNHDANPARAGSRTDWHYRASGMREEGDDILRNPSDLVSELRGRTDSRCTPRTGVVAIADVLAGDPASVYVTGYDCYRSAHSVMPSTAGRPIGGHDNVSDHALLRELCASDTVEVDDVLRDALADDPVSEAEAQEIHIQEANMIIKRKKQPNQVDRPNLSDLSAEDLRDLCRTRGLTVRGTKSELIARLEDADHLILEDDPS